MSYSPVDRKALLVMKEAMTAQAKTDQRFITPIRQLETYLVMDDQTLQQRALYLLELVMLSRVLIANKSMRYGNAATVGVLTHYLPDRITAYQRALKLKEKVSLNQFLAKDPLLPRMIREAFWLPNSVVDQTNIEWFNTSLKERGYKASIVTANDPELMAAVMVKIQFNDGSFHLERDKCRIW